MFTVSAGDVIEATWSKPAQITPAPPPAPGPADGRLDQVPTAPQDPGVPMYP